MRGGVAVDDRGEVGFVNDFTFSGVKRFYTVANHSDGFVRAWHGHRLVGAERSTAAHCAATDLPDRTIADGAQ